MKPDEFDALSKEDQAAELSRAACVASVEKIERMMKENRQNPSGKLRRQEHDRKLVLRQSPGEKGMEL